MTPLERYQADLLREDFHADTAQENAVRLTQRLFDALLTDGNNGNSFLEKIRQNFQKDKTNFIKGLYFWGGVGRGKTYIIDSFYDSLPFKEKQRIHFHRFMQMVHAQLGNLKGVSDPLQIVADNIASETEVLCFDEFHVSDITDAMLLGGLLKALFERGVILVTTSNEAPDQLYWDGLQRQRFLPVIDLIKKYTEVVSMDSGVDYRLSYLDKAEIYHSPIDDKATARLEIYFNHIAPSEVMQDVPIEIEGRMIQTIRLSDGVVWFDFDAICDGPRGPADYIEIARLFQSVLISGLPVMDEMTNDKAKRFMILVDEFYDRNVKLIVTAEEEPSKLYTGKRLAKPFLRTISRLEEMHTHDYLAKQHLP
ncbi:MAG: AFG1 family ATPase [Gammaproteobacteria bacterium]|nr:AFG1 family ATPase [Gammaproteobacteria bacterium]MCK5499137.1 AFG1 family ATPase [Gammaproteobacteria bacterium]